jgi:hypothetical protein
MIKGNTEEHKFELIGSLLISGLSILGLETKIYKGDSIKVRLKKNGMFLFFIVSSTSLFIINK